MPYLDPSLILHWEFWPLQVAKFFLHFPWSNQCFCFLCDWIFCLHFWSALMKAFCCLLAMSIFPENKFLFFLYFPTYFCFLLESLIQENHFFLKEDMTFRSFVISNFNFFSAFFFDPCKGPLYLLVVGINSW